MIHHNQTNVSLAHRVEATTMNGSSERSIQQPHRGPVVDLDSAGADEPLDLTKPLDLSKRSSKPLPPAPPLHYVPNGAPRRVQAGVQHINRHNHLCEVDASNVPPLRSTKYPLQRGLAYVQPRKATFSRNGGIPEARVSDTQAIKSLQQKVVRPEQQAMVNYAAMQQRVRSEAANIAALQAQATNAAQEAVKQAMARHAAATAAKARKEARTTALSNGDLAHRSLSQSQMFEAQRKRLHTGRMASVKPVQRNISAADIRTYAMERQLAQLSAMRERQSEQDLVRAYRQMMASTKATSNSFAKQPHNRPRPDITSETSTSHEPSLPKQLPGTTERHPARGFEAKHAHYSPQQQRIIDSQIAASKQSGFAAQVRAREQAMVKQQQELIMRQQRQLVKEVSNNRRLQEFAKIEQNRKVMMDEFNNKQLATRMRMREEQGLAKKHVGQTAIHAPPSPEYLEALASYNAARSGQSQKRIVRGPSHTMSPPSMHSMSVPQGVRKPSTSIPRDDRSTVKSNSPQAEVNTASKVYASTKRPSMSPHDDAIPRKIKATSPETQGGNIFNNAIAEVQRSVVAQQLLMNTYKDMTGKKLSSVPVRERLLMARLSDRDRHDLMVAKMIEEQTLREQQDSGSGNKTTLNNIASKAEDGTLHVPRRAHENLTRTIDNPTTNRHVPISSQSRLSKNIISPGPRSNEESSAEYLAQDSLMKQRNETAQVQPAMTRPRLPSYDDAIAAQRSLTSGEKSKKLTPDTMSSVARQLVSSSQDWFKSYLSREMEQQANSLSHNDQSKLDKRILTGDGHSSLKDFSTSEHVATSPVIESARQPTTEQKSLKESEGPVVGKEANSSSNNEVRKPSPTLPLTPPILDALGLGGRGQLADSMKTNDNDAGAKSAIDVKRSFAKAFSDVYLTQSQGHSEMEPLSRQTKPSRRANVVSPEKQIETLPETTGVETEQQQSSDKTPDPSQGSEAKRTENDLMQADTASLGSEERALQRAILRFNVLERQVSVSDQTEEAPASERAPERAPERIGKTNSRLKEAQRRKRRKLSKFRKRIRGPRTISSVTNIPGLQSGRKRGRPRRSSLPPPADMAALMRTKFQDFIPTILERRTRNSGSGRVRNYRSMYDARNIRYELEIEKERAKVMERRRRLREFNNVDNASATETDEPAPEEDYVYVPPPKRPRGRPRTKPRDENSGSPAKHNSEQEKEDVAPSEAGPGKDEDSPTKPLRVVLDQNTPNHIKMKFVNIRSMSMNEAQEEEVVAPPQRRGRGRPRKSDGKCKSKTKNLGPPKSPEPPKLEMMSPCGKKENERDYEDFVQDPDYDVINPDLTLPEYARVIRPDPPQDMKRFPLNKKLGETYLHRAASQGNMEILSYCIDYRVVDVNARDNAGYTALHDSCVEGRLDIAQYLLSHGADVNASAADGTRPIHDAVDNDRVQLVRLLLAYGADPFLATNTGRRITKLALRKSSEMKTLLFGYLQDVNGDRSKLEDAPQHALDYQWSFSGSCRTFDSNTSSKTYTFADVPGPDDGKNTDSGEEDEGVFFEMSDKPILPSYNIRMDKDDKFRNWLLLSDVTKRLSLTSLELTQSHPDLESVTLPAYQFNQSAQESQIINSTLPVRPGDDVNANPEVKGEEVTLIELNNSLRNVLGMEVKYIR